MCAANSINSTPKRVPDPLEILASLTERETDKCTFSILQFHMHLAIDCTERLLEGKRQRRLQLQNEVKLPTKRTLYDQSPCTKRFDISSSWWSCSTKSAFVRNAVCLWLEKCSIRQETVALLRRERIQLQRLRRRLNDNHLWQSLRVWTTRQTAAIMTWENITPTINTGKALWYDG